MTTFNFRGLPDCFVRMIRFFVLRFLQRTQKSSDHSLILTSSEYMASIWYWRKRSRRAFVICPNPRSECCSPSDLWSGSRCSCTGSWWRLPQASCTPWEQELADKSQRLHQQGTQQCWVSIKRKKTLSTRSKSFGVRPLTKLRSSSCSFDKPRKSSFPLLGVLKWAKATWSRESTTVLNPGADRTT